MRKFIEGVGEAMRTFFERLDGKTFLGAIVLIGYLLLINKLISRSTTIPNADLVKDQLLVIGPVIGMIASALWRTTGADERRTDALIGAKNTLEAAAAPTLALPAPIVPPAGPGQISVPAQTIDTTGPAVVGQDPWNKAPEA